MNTKAVSLNQATDPAEEERIAHQRRMADMLQQESMQPLPSGQMHGGAFVPTHWTSGLAKVLQGFTAGDMREKAAEEHKALALRQQERRGADMSMLIQALQGKPGQAAGLNEDASGNVTQRDAIPGMNSQQSLQQALPMIQDPQLQSVGLGQLMNQINANAPKPPNWKVESRFNPQTGRDEKVMVDMNNPANVQPFGGQKAGSVQFGPGGVAFDPQATAPGTVQNNPNNLIQIGPNNQPVLNQPLFNAKRDIAAAGGTKVNVSTGTEKKYGEQFAGKIAEQDVGLLEAARKAPDLAARSNSIKETLASGKVITGAGADYRLALGKALNLVGATDAETIANTETLSTSLARNTLDSIKASGLGSGNGFSNADRDFLEKAAGGKINLEGATIGKLADLAHRAAEQSTVTWNKRVKDIPESALGGTGIKRDPIAVPPLYGSKGKPALNDRTRQLLDQYAPEGR